MIVPLQSSDAVGIDVTVAGVNKFSAGNASWLGTGAELSTTVTVTGADNNISIPLALVILTV